MKVSVIIPTYNRYHSLLNAVKSVMASENLSRFPESHTPESHTPESHTPESHTPESHTPESHTPESHTPESHTPESHTPDLEIIVIDDGSTQEEYQNLEIPGCIIIHGKKGGASHARNLGLKIATGTYIAFLDDDDIWFPWKLRLQISAMESTGCRMSCTEGWTGHGEYNNSKKYLLYSQLTSLFVWDYPTGNIWTKKEIDVHNYCICSSVIIHRDMVEKVGEFSDIRIGEDWQFWKKVLNYTNCIYIPTPCVYYDNHAEKM